MNSGAIFTLNVVLTKISSFMLYGVGHLRPLLRPADGSSQTATTTYIAE